MLNPGTLADDLVPDVDALLRDAEVLIELVNTIAASDTTPPVEDALDDIDTMLEQMARNVEVAQKTAQATRANLDAQS